MPAERICTKCRTPKPTSEFHKDRSREDGLSTWCATCRCAYSAAWYAKNPRERRVSPEKAREYSNRWVAKNPGYWRDRHLRRKYGISEEEYLALVEAQGGRCAICGGEQDCHSRQPGSTMRLTVDHDHATGRVRGLLCFSCNTGLGNLKDDPTLLEIAAEYIRASS